MTNFYPYRSRRRFAHSGRGGGINQDNTWTVRTEAIGKGASDESPYLLANEWISANIAQFLRLPVPPFALVRKRSPSTAMFISYSYDGDEKPDDVNPDALYASQPDICVGITLLDILVANCDRHGGNIKVDKPASPKSVYIFDHESAVLRSREGWR